jgi:competence protein ComK
MEGKHTIFVDQTPIQLLNANLKFMCSNLTGAIDGARAILGKNISMCPIIINYTQGICIFPTKSPFKDNNIWFNPQHIIKTEPHGSKTDVYLSNGITIHIGQSQSSFHHKIQKAEQLLRIIQYRGNGTMTFLLVEKNEEEVITEEAGIYNFDLSNKDHDQ